MAPKKAKAATEATAPAPAAAAQPSAGVPPTPPLKSNPDGPSAGAPPPIALPAVSVTPAEAVEVVQLFSAAPDQVPSLEQYAQLLAIIDSNPANVVPPHVRAKALVVIGQHGYQVESALNKTALFLTAILTADDNAAVLQIAAINAITSIAAKLRTKQFEMVRDMFDVFIQVSMEGSGFALNVRQAARGAMNQLLEINFSAAFTKLLHLLSDEREADDLTYVTRERGLALEMLHNLVTSPSYSSTWTDEVQQHLLKFLAPVFPAVSPDQFSRLAEIAAQLPLVKSKQGANLIDVVLAGFKPESLRSFESVALLGPYVPRTCVSDALAAKLFPLVSIYVSGEQPKPPQSTVTRLAFLKALVLASRVCSESAAATYLPVLSQLIVHHANTTDYTELECLLMSLSLLGHRNAAVALPIIHDEALLNRVTALHNEVKATKEAATVAIHTLVERDQATPQHGEAFACLSNLANMTEAFAAKKLPTAAMQTSWDGRKALPRASAVVVPYQAKRGRT